MCSIGQKSRELSHPLSPAAELAFGSVTQVWMESTVLSHRVGPLSM